MRPTSMHVRTKLLILLVFLLVACFPTATRCDDGIMFPIVVHKQSTPKTTYLSIPYTAFIGPLNATGALLMTGACWSDNSSILIYLGAPVMLPHGAVIKELRVDYYQYYPTDEGTFNLFRVDSASQHTTMASLKCGSAGGGRVATTAITAPVVDNADYSYVIQAWGFRCDRTMAIRSVRITYETL